MISLTFGEKEIEIAAAMNGVRGASPLFAQCSIQRLR
jgi:hypothetical protein